MRLIIILTLIQIGLTAPKPELWSAIKKSVEVNHGSITVIEFTKGKRRQVYTPTTQSLWAQDIKEVKVGNKIYFLSSWSKGGRNLLFRVFDPEVSVEPICEVVSFAESSRLRVNSGQLQVFVVPDNPPGEKVGLKKPYWKNCRKL